jgi:hypothetical protein
MEGNATSPRTLTYTLNFSQVVRGSLTLRLLVFILDLLGLEPSLRAAVNPAPVVSCTALLHITYQGSIVEEIPA